jgi:hypothetical protein
MTTLRSVRRLFTKPSRKRQNVQEKDPPKKPKRRKVKSSIKVSENHIEARGEAAADLLKGLCKAYNLEDPFPKK